MLFYNVYLKGKEEKNFLGKYLHWTYFCDWNCHVFIPKIAYGMYTCGVDMNIRSLFLPYIMKIWDKFISEMYGCMCKSRWWYIHSYIIYEQYFHLQKKLFHLCITFPDAVSSSSFLSSILHRLYGCSWLYHTCLLILFLNIEWIIFAYSSFHSFLHIHKYIFTSPGLLLTLILIKV